MLLRNKIFTVALGFGLLGTPVSAFWRMTCGLVQTGRIDPIISPGAVSGHVHKISGANTLSPSSDFTSLQNSRCTSCEVQKDLSAYWTPQLYYQYANGSFVEVPGGGTVVYYLGRGDVTDDIVPFPPGFRMLSGNPFLRAPNASATTWDGSEPVANRVKFACLDGTGNPETDNMARTDCKDGLRAEVHFQSCWDGVNVYKADQSHVAYLSGMDKGTCPDTHPVHFMTLFFEVYYSVNNVPGLGDGGQGQYVFAQGDPTGYGFHGDFINGWDNTTLYNAIQQCSINDSVTGITNPDQCPAFNGSLDHFSSTNCAAEKPLIDEPVHGWLDTLPGCNPIQTGPAAATQATTCSSTATLNGYSPPTYTPMFDPSPGTALPTNNTWTYAGCAREPTYARALTAKSTTLAADMTIDACVEFCRGYPLAGLEYRNQCYCGATLQGTTLNTTQGCEAEPKMVCAGNYTQWCGGDALLTVWTSSSSSSPPSSSSSSSGLAARSPPATGGWASSLIARLLGGADASLTSSSAPTPTAGLGKRRLTTVTGTEVESFKLLAGGAGPREAGDLET